MKAMLALMALGASALAVNAQDAGGPQNGNGPSEHHPRGHRPPPPAIIAALDANHDHVIDSNEIANASAVLKKLDKNGDGKLTPDEFVGKRPHRPPQDGDFNRPHHDRPDGPPGANQDDSSDDQPPGPPPGDE